MKNETNDYIYQDEPIIKRNEATTSAAEKAIRQVRLLALSMRGKYHSKEQIFYLEGKILENIEDDFNYQGLIQMYYPTYEDLSNEDLRGFLTWRTQVRKGNFQQTSLAFVFLYIYELINQIGVDTPIDGLNKLKAFAKAYDEIDHLVIRYVNRWLFDYVVYYQLDCHLLDNYPIIKFDNKINIINNIKDFDHDTVFQTLNSLSKYNLETTPFFKQNEKAVKNITVNCFAKIMIYYDNHHRNTLIEDFFHYQKNMNINLFPDCNFYDYIYHRDFTYKINNLREYTYKSGCWYFTGFSTFRIVSKELGEMFKTIDSMIREKYNFKRSIKKGSNFKWLTKIIEEEITIYKKEEEKIPDITLDLSILNKIREDAEITKEKLIVEEEKEEITINEIPETPEYDLTLEEYKYLKHLLYGIEFTSNTLTSIIIDKINDKLFDVFNDTIITEEDKPQIVVDYIEELKGMIKP